MLNLPNIIKVLVFSEIDFIQKEDVLNTDIKKLKRLKKAINIFIKSIDKIGYKGKVKIIGKEIL